MAFVELPDICTCLKLHDENKRLKRKYVRLVERNRKLETHVAEMESQVGRRGTIRDRDTSGLCCKDKHHQECQVNKVPQSSHSQLDPENMNKILEGYSEVSRKYSRMVAESTKLKESIATLKVEKREVEKQLESSQLHADGLVKLNERLTSQISSLKREQSISGMNKKLAAVTKERDALREKQLKWKAEFECLDKNFFEEIEDLKYALQQSAKLCQSYDRTMRKLCRRHDIPFPTVTPSCD
ncbi:centrosomal protein of 290 kDa-like [Corticium candelabrum]|uniref:centrosomal protein of 290 kDa-like n=1 Tax=Corticium candelabrum TaxID=121492 RepID=UPI002E25A8D1|nr:centrosomal protein of 290 kDa-like [Corticium candelabrum]